MAAGPLTCISAEPRGAELNHRDRRAERGGLRERLQARLLLGGEAPSDPRLQRRGEAVVEAAAQAAIVRHLLAVAALGIERVGEEFGELLAGELRVQHVLRKLRGNI